MLTSVYKMILIVVLSLYFFQVHGMLSQMDPAIVAYCDNIAAQGGPVHFSDELGGSTFPATPVGELGTATRMSARLRNVQPEVNMDQSYEALKRTKKSSDDAHGGIDAFPVCILFLNVKLWYLEGSFIPSTDGV